jgi:hypothetical protein
MAKIGRIGIGLALVIGITAAFWPVTPNMPHVLAQNSPQTTTSGEWNASLNKEDSKIQLNLERRTKRGGRNQNGQTYDFAELQGLTREQALNGGPVKFSLVREAGRIDCEGTFQNGKGSGTFTFTANPAFVSAMKSRGFDFDADSKRRQNDDDGENRLDDRLISATTLNVTTALADDLTGVFGKLGTEDLFKAAIFKIDSQFAREMKASGFENLGMEDLVKARIFKIDASFAKQVSDMGFQKEPFESLVKMQIFKVTPEFIAEVRNEGLTNIQVEDMVKLRIFKIDAQFIRDAKADGVPLEVERLVQRRIGVSRR